MTHKPERILVTGGAGFIGSNLLLYMVPRYPGVQFVNLDNLSYAGNLENVRSLEIAKNYRFVRGDVADRDLVLRLFSHHRFTTVIHLAAESHVDRSIMAPLTFLHVNTVGTATLLEAARHSWEDRADHPGRYRFFHVSTDEVFGSLGEDGVFSENTPYDPRSPYSASKAAADHFVRAYAHTYGLPICISNCSNNYGPFQYPEKLIPVTIQHAINKHPVPVYGKGANIRDWLHVTDHCRAIDTILHHGAPGDTYLVGGNNERRNLDLVGTVLDLVDEQLGRKPGTGRDLITFVTDRPGHDYRYAIDATHLRGTLGWEPTVSLEEGLRDTVAWYLSHRDWLSRVASRRHP